MMTTQEKFAEKLLQHIKEKHNSYLRIVNKEGTCACQYLLPIGKNT